MHSAKGLDIIFESALPERVGNEGFAAGAVGGVVGVVAFGDGVRQGGIELAGYDLVGACLGVAELAGGKIAAFSASGRAKGAAEDGPVLIEVAGAGGGIENGTELVVGEVFKGAGGLLVLGEDAGGDVAGETGVKTPERGSYPLAQAEGSAGIGYGKEFEALAEASRVLMGDGEYAMAALGASGPASEV